MKDSLTIWEVEEYKRKFGSQGGMNIKKIWLLYPDLSTNNQPPRLVSYEDNP